jgi:amino acid transporter, AAT family
VIKIGSSVAGRFINAIIMISVQSAGNHALLAGTNHAAHILARLKSNKIPWIAVLATNFTNTLYFASTYIGAGQVRSWLQNIVGVSNQLFWIIIGITSPTFRAALEGLGKTHLLPLRNETYSWGP